MPRDPVTGRFQRAEPPKHSDDLVARAAFITLIVIVGGALLGVVVEAFH